MQRATSSAVDLYLDYNGSTPLAPEALEVAFPYLVEHHGNPSASHPMGAAPKAAIERAKAESAAALGCSAGELVHTSGGSESNNHALLGVAALRPGGHFVVSAIEHKSVLSTVAELERRGHPVTRVLPREDGAVRAADIASVLRPETALVSVMGANNETGVVQPFEEIGALCRARGVVYHCDWVCALGKLDLDLSRSMIDLLSIGAHKLHGPKGVGLTYIRRGVAVSPLIHGCGQQDGARGGTENAFGAVAFAKCLTMLAAGAFPSHARLAELRDGLWEGIRGRFPSARRNGSGSFLPNTLNVAFEGELGIELLKQLGQHGVCVAAGAPSHVLTAMGLPPTRARASLRFSLGRHSDERTIAATLDALSSCVRDRAPSGAPATAGAPHPTTTSGRVTR
jgi:cysteine desulfurase